VVAGGGREAAEEMSDDNRPTIDYATPPRRNRTLGDRALSFGRWLCTPRPMGVYYVVMFVLSIVAIIVALLIRLVVTTIWDH
jgi:hypothetical protein